MTTTLTLTTPRGLTPRRELQRAVVTMVATLGTFGTALLLQRISHQNLSTIILSVVLALSLSRLPQHAPAHSRLLDLAVVPLVALGATSVGQLLLQHPNLGDITFVAALTAAMWLRQFGSRAARLARLLTLPVTSILVVPAAGLGLGAHARLWQMVAALVALAWVTAAQAAARWCNFLPPDVHSIRPAPSQPAQSRRRLSGHTRMALQLAIALTAAFVIGRIYFPGHWNWTVLTATIVCGGGPSRGQVVMKGTARLLGAGVGTLVATLLATNLPGHHDETVVVIFLLLFIGSWWREIHYAAWAACVTCVMALLNDYLGVTSTTSLLSTRLWAISVGALCATAVCCVVVPVPTSSIVRRGRAYVLQSLGDVLHGIADAAPDVPYRLHQFELRAVELRRARRPLWLQQSLVGWIWPADSVVLRTTAAVLHCVGPLRTVAGVALSGAADDDLRQSARLVARNVGRTRQRLGGTVPEGNDVLVEVSDIRLAPLNQALLAITQPGAIEPSGGWLRS